jgi:hypothetical protein
MKAFSSEMGLGIQVRPGTLKQFVIPLKKGIQEEPLADSRSLSLDSNFHGNDRKG